MRVALRTIARRAVLLSGALLVLVPAAVVAAPGTLPYDSAQTTPAQSQNFVAGPGPLEFHFVSPDCRGASLFADVANANELAPDGRFTDGARKEHIQLTETPAGSGIYNGQATGSWLQTPATYYWSASGVVDCTGDEYDFAVDRVSSARSIVIKNAPPPPGSDQDPEIPDENELLTIAQAKAEIPGLILKRTKKVARGLKRKCSRRGEGSILVVACTVSWSDNKKYSYNGSMRLALNDDGTLSVRFDGRRATRACVKRKGGKKCFKKWIFSYDAV